MHAVAPRLDGGGDDRLHVEVRRDGIGTGGQLAALRRDAGVQRACVGRRVHADVSMPSPCAAAAIRIAISPRLAISTRCSALTVRLRRADAGGADGDPEDDPSDLSSRPRALRMRRSARRHRGAAHVRPSYGEPVIVTGALVERLERSAARAAASLVDAISAVAGPGSGAAWSPSGAGVLAASGPGRYVNRAVGVTLAELGHAELDAIASWFAQRDLPPVIELSAHAPAATVAALAARGYRPAWFRAMFVLELRPSERDRRGAGAGGRGGGRGPGDAWRTRCGSRPGADR